MIRKGLEGSFKILYFFKKGLTQKNLFDKFKQINLQIQDNKTLFKYSTFPQSLGSFVVLSQSPKGLVTSTIVCFATICYGRSKRRSYSTISALKRMGIGKELQRFFFRGFCRGLQKLQLQEQWCFDIIDSTVVNIVTAEYGG